MKIAVVGANGRSGRIFIDYAIARGHKVNAGVHNRNNLLENADLRVIKCDATNKEQLKHLLRDQDAVVSFIGHVKKSPDFVQTETMKALVEIMKELKIKRLVSITGTGVRQKGDKIPLIDRILNLGLSVFDPTRLKDGIEHAKVLKESGLDWTILRVLKMQNVKPKPFTLKENGPTKLYVSREEVARAALEVLEDNSFIHKYPILSNKRGV